MSDKGNIVGQRDDSPTNDVEDRGVGATRITPKRALHVNLRDNSGSEIASSNPLPVTASSLPLPTGAATAANQATTNSKLDTLISGVNTELPAAAALADGTANPTAPAVAAHAMGLNASGTWDKARLGAVFDLDTGAGTQNVAGVSLRKGASGGSVEAGTASDPLYFAASSLPLPSGAATSAKQDTGNSSLATIASTVSTASNQTAGNLTLEQIKTALEELQIALLQLIAHTDRISAARGIASDLRVTLLSGALTSLGTLTTLTSMTQLAGYSAAPMMWSQMNQAAIQSNINNVVVS